MNPRPVLETLGYDRAEGSVGLMQPSAIYEQRVNVDASETTRLAQRVGVKGVLGFWGVSGWDWAWFAGVPWAEGPSGFSVNIRPCASGTYGRAVWEGRWRVGIDFLLRCRWHVWRGFGDGAASGALLWSVIRRRRVGGLR